MTGQSGKTDDQQAPARTPTDGESARQLAWETSVIGSFGHMLSRAVSVGSGVLGLLGIAYIFGFMASRAYMREFGAEWLVAEMSSRSILAFGIWPAALAAIFGYLMLDDMAARKSGARNILRLYGGYLYAAGIVFIALVPLAERFLGPRAGSLAAYGAWGIWTMVVAACANKIAMLIRSHQFRWDRVDLKLAWTLLFAALYFVPTYFGESTGMDSARLSESRLPIVSLVNDEGRSYRLLASNSGRFFIAELAERQSDIRVRMVGPELIAAITPYGASLSPAEPAIDAAKTSAASGSAQTAPSPEGVDDSTGGQATRS